MHGFTLIELMITVAVAAILVMIAVPAYTSQTQKSRRTDARTALLDLASREESFLALNNAYTTVLGNLGYPAAAAVPYTVGSGYYQITAINVTAAAVGVLPTFNITAVPIGTQVNDLQCQSFTITNAGLQSAVDNTGANSTATCWN